MAKKKRSDYMYLGNFAVLGYEVKVLMDALDITDRQGPLAEASKFKHNRQTYGPFKVTVLAPKEDQPKEKRARAKKKKL